ncbi:hypothetical protein Ancab_034715 [Ancistrocladus abbreviatus]
MAKFTLINATDSTLSSTSSFPVSPKLKSFLSALWGLSLKLMVVTEQESNHNGSSSMERVMEAYFYATLFDCLEFTMPRESTEQQRRSCSLERKSRTPCLVAQEVGLCGEVEVMDLGMSVF